MYFQLLRGCISNYYEDVFPTTTRMKIKKHRDVILLTSRCFFALRVSRLEDDLLALVGDVEMAL